MPFDQPSESGAVPPGHVLPPLSLLDPRVEPRPISERWLMQTARGLEEKLRELRIGGDVVRIVPGPVVTTFEFRPEVDVKGFRFSGLADDLSLMLRVESVRIERRPREPVLAIALPGPVRQPISLRELLESAVASGTDAALPIPIGTTAAGEPFSTDLARLPHLLLAGSDGAGAAAPLAAMMASLVCRVTPDQARLVLVDPSRLELGLFDGIPHLLTPVIVDPPRSAHALLWAARSWRSATGSLRGMDSAASTTTTGASAVALAGPTREA